MFLKCVHQDAVNILKDVLNNPLLITQSQKALMMEYRFLWCKYLQTIKSDDWLMKYPI